MGFGLLFTGYAIANMFTLIPSYSFIGMLLGYFIIFCALYELRKYCPTFLYSLIITVVMIFCSFFECFKGLDTHMTWGVLYEGALISQIFEFAEFVLALLFNLTLLYGIADMGRRVELDEVRSKAYRNMIFVIIYYAYQMFLFLPLAFIEQEKAFLMSLLMILLLTYTVINLALIFKCYAFICPQGDEDMPVKPSRFDFVNRMRAKSDQKEKEAMEYYQKKADDLKKRRENKKKKKKK